MADSALVCRDSRRREVLRRGNDGCPIWNGIDYVELLDDPPPVGTVISGSRLRVCFLCQVPDDLAPNQVVLSSEVLRKQVRITKVCSDCAADCAELETETSLCPSAAYTLTIQRPRDFDPQFATFRFIATSETTDVDPAPVPACPPRSRVEPHVNYLARDYASFRQLLFDRLALTMPEWTERHVPDLGVTLIEMFAYVGDYLAYQQDAVATEAYLNTARLRISVARHARLIDYQLHEGCNARTFVQLAVSEDARFDPLDVCFITAHPDESLKNSPVLHVTRLNGLPSNSFQAFEVVRLDSRCQKLACQDITNLVGLIGCFVTLTQDRSADAGRLLAHFIWNSLPSDLRFRLKEYAGIATEPPPAMLADQLIEGLNVVLQQYCLVSQDPTGTIARGRSCVPLSETLARNSVDSNIALFKMIFADFVARYDDRQIELYAAHNEITFYTWDQRECCLPTGTTRATLRDGPAPCKADEDEEPCAPRVELYDDPPGSGADLPASTGSAANSSMENAAAGTAPAWEPSDDSSTAFQPQPVDCSAFVRPHLGAWNLRHLSPGDILILEEIKGPITHFAADADPAHRQAVRLTRVNFCLDPVSRTRVVEIEWSPEDALRFPLCISSVGPAELDCPFDQRISVARGNIVLADHGKRLDKNEWLGVTKSSEMPPTCRQNLDGAIPAPASTRADLFRPALKEPGLTWAAPVRPCDTATTLLVQESHKALPAIEVFGFPVRDDFADAAPPPGTPPRLLVDSDDYDDPRLLLQRLPQFSDVEIRRLADLLPPDAARFLQNHRLQASSNRTGHCADPVGYEQFRLALRASLQWTVKASLLDSTRDDRDCVIETDNDGRTHLRFGNDDLGRRPPPRMSFYAWYRTGRGTAGNVGADKIKHVVYRTQPLSAITRVRNPLSASGACDPETIDHARILAPQQFLKKRRAIVANDYAEIALRDFASRVQQARATLNWMGMWYEVAVAIDPKSEVSDPEQLLQEVQRHLERFRRINHVVRVDLPAYVPLFIEITVCVTAGYLRAHVQTELLNQFSNRELTDGTKGFFHPDNFSFGDALYLSRVVQAARKVEGVENVSVTRFERRGQGDQGELRAGLIPFGPLEIPRVDNDALRPENGCLCLDMRGDR